MDRNTVTGLLLMAAVFFGFMWLTPKKENTGAYTEPDTEAEAPARLTSTDALSETECQWLVKNINDNGEPVVLADSTRAMRLHFGAIDLTASGDSVFGTVAVAGKALDWNDIRSADLTKMDVREQQQAVEAVRNASNAIGRYGKFARFLSGNDSVINLDNDVLHLQLSAKSGSITRAELTKYDTEYTPDETKKRKEPVVVFADGSNTFDFQLPLPQAVSTADLFFTPEVANDSTVLMKLPLGDDAFWGLEYTLPHGDSYVVRIRVVQRNLTSVIESNNRNLGVNWRQDLIRQEKGKMFEENNSGLYYKYAGGSVENLSERKSEKEDRKAKIRWIGFKNQFFSSVLIGERPFNTADFDSQYLKNDPWILKKFAAEATVNDYDLNAGNPASFSLFIGPNLYPLLSSLDHRTVADENLSLTRLIPLGWSIFRWINTGIVIPIFNLLGSWLHDYGIIILLMTVFIKIILFPLTYKSFKSQAKMRVLAPDIKAINDKYPGNQNAMIRQQKTMELYRKAGANPMSGCLPMMLQMPILFAMFAFFPSAIELRGQSFLWAKDLAAPDAIISWSAHIPLVSEYFGNHISLFCLLMTATNIIYTHINMQSSAGTQMPGMKWMMYIMPLMFLVFFNNYAAGLSYYYFVSLLITIIQTYAFRYFIKEEDVRKEMAANAKKPAKKGWMQGKLEEMQRQQQAMLREQQRRQNRR